MHKDNDQWGDEVPGGGNYISFDAKNIPVIGKLINKGNSNFQYEKGPKAGQYKPEYEFEGLNGEVFKITPPADLASKLARVSLGTTVRMMWTGDQKIQGQPSPMKVFSVVPRLG